MLLRQIYQQATFADQVIFIVALVFLSWLYWHYWIVGGLQFLHYAIIFTPDHARQSIDLNKDQIITVAGYLGESIIEVSQGRIRFIASPCRGKYCIHAGWLTHRGSFVTCLPNRVSIALGGYDASQLDAIAY